MKGFSDCILPLPEVAVETIYKAAKPETERRLPVTLH